jgi:hypothetical protein
VSGASLFTTIERLPLNAPRLLPAAGKQPQTPNQRTGGFFSPTRPPGLELGRYSSSPPRFPPSPPSVPAAARSSPAADTRDTEHRTPAGREASAAVHALTLTRPSDEPRYKPRPPRNSAPAIAAQAPRGKVGTGSPRPTEPQTPRSERKPLKTGAAKREVPLTASIARELKLHRIASPFKAPADFVFATRTGLPMGWSNVIPRGLHKAACWMQL